MIIELVGSTGAGKSTLARLLQRRNRSLGRVVLADDLVLDRPGRRWIHNPSALNVVADVTVLPSLLGSLGHNGEFIRFALHRIRRHAPSTLARYNYMREVARNIGKQELARRVGATGTVVVDEGAVLTAYHLFVYSNGPFSQADLEDFARLVPLPDRVVYVKAPLKVLVDRALKRPDRRRELAACDRKDVERWIERALDVFEGLAVTPAIRDRLVTVEDGDDSPGRQRAVLTQIEAVINSQDQAVPRGRGPLPTRPGW
jgi:thymidylate kinase